MTKKELEFENQYLRKRLEKIHQKVDDDNNKENLDILSFNARKLGAIRYMSEQQNIDEELRFAKSMEKFRIKHEKTYGKEEIV